MVIEMGVDKNLVSIFVEGELEQQSIGVQDTGDITGFSNHGEDEINQIISDSITLDNTIPEESDVLGTKYFTNKITSESFILTNYKNSSKQSWVHLGTHVSCIRETDN